MCQWTLEHRKEALAVGLLERFIWEGNFETNVYGGICGFDAERDGGLSSVSSDIFRFSK
jgi:hypothetical protein